ncbi:hypothetical protein DRN74_03410 [Candidatus Micrarchaeota archaeon]|nr:MAG: hypothetical protein DRN74_03410 [Candidatus Micrarchaeota archaeon]
MALSSNTLSCAVSLTARFNFSPNVFSLLPLTIPRLISLTAFMFPKYLNFIAETHRTSATRAEQGFSQAQGFQIHELALDYFLLEGRKARDYIICILLTSGGLLHFPALRLPHPLSL